VKILWHSVHPGVGSGYGTQTATFTPRIAALGHDLAISAYYGQQGFKSIWNGLPVYPAYAKAYGGDIVVPHAIDWFGGGKPGLSFRDVANSGLILTLGDVWTFQQPLLAEMNVASWVPIDHEHVPPAVFDWFKEMGAVPIAMSRFGERALREAGLDPLYVPHGIDTNVFRPGDKAQARERVGLPQDAFVVAMVAANVGKDGTRKAFFEQIVAFGELRKKHSDAMFVIHTDVTNPYGLDLVRLLSDLPEDSYMFTDQYAYKVGMPASAVADVYRAADVLTNTSWGEGFGIPIVEAQACGTPVIVTDTTAMPELCGAGWKVPGEALWHEAQHAWARRPLIGGIVDAYQQAYDQARDDDLRARAWAFAQDYDADTVLTEYWKPALERLEQAVEAARTDTTAPRPAKPVVREADNLLWLARPGSDDWTGYADHEPWLKPLFDDLLPDGGVLLDVGAHVGRWTVRLAGRAGHVVAVEANPATASTLRRHLAMNDVTNVTVVEVAAWDERARLRLWDPNGLVEGGGTRTLPASNGDGTVEAVRLDAHRPTLDALAAAGRLDLVKVDLEGADIHALRGMAGILATYRPALLIECHDLYGYYERADLEQALADLGYDFHVGASTMSTWHPDGPVEPRPADYLVATPATADIGR
jgi:FkbM family methyltransferase